MNKALDIGIMVVNYYTTYTTIYYKCGVIINIWSCDKFDNNLI